jgi:abortive infection bacteriophage resistance protein
MARPSKLTPDIQQRIGENIALGMTYKLACESACVTYKTFNLWMQQGKNSTSGKYYQFAQHIKNAMPTELGNSLRN